MPLRWRERNSMHCGYNGHGRLDTFLDASTSDLPQDFFFLAGNGVIAGMTVNAKVIQKPLEEFPMQQNPKVMIS